VFGSMGSFDFVERSIEFGKWTLKLKKKDVR
jgi:hypothetical protein